MKLRTRSILIAATLGSVMAWAGDASDIKRLLAEKPQALGLAVPGMVAGSPGMESGTAEHYITLLVQGDGTTRIFARH